MLSNPCSNFPSLGSSGQHKFIPWVSKVSTKHVCFMYFRFWFSVQTKLCSWLSLFSFFQTQKALNCPQNFHLAFNIQEWVIVRKLKGNYASFGYQVGSFVCFCFFCFLILSNHIRNYSGGIIIFSEQEQYLSCNCCICVTF